jgi:hypothetical protein
VCSSPTHDAIGGFGGLLALSLMTDQTIHPAGLLVLVGCTVTMGLAETRASLRQIRLDKPNLEPRALLRAELRAELREKGMTPKQAAKEASAAAFKAIPQPHWKGPAKEDRRKARMFAFVGGCVSAWPVAVSYAASRLPDQLERGWRVKIFKRWTVTIIPRVDHRELTHWPITAALLLFGLHYGLLRLGRACGNSEAGDVAAAVTLFGGVGYVGHLLADGITRGGLPFLGPFVKDDLHLLPKQVRVWRWTLRPRLLVGGKADALVMLAASGGTVALALTMGGWA